MNPMIVIAKLTFREAIRRKILLAGLVLGIAFIIIYSLGLHFIITEVNRVAEAKVPSGVAETILGVESKNTLLMAGLYAVTFLSIAMAALLGADTLAGEINSGTIQTIATKPIRRADVVLGKWLGFAGLLGLYQLLTAGGVILSMYIQAHYAPDNLLSGVMLIYLESLLIMTVTLMCSASFPALATGGIVFGLYGLAFIGGWIEQIGAVLHNSTAVQIGIITSLIIPSEALWRRAAFEMQTPLASVLGVSPFGASSVPSVLMVVYAIVYICVTLMIAVRIFQKRDL